jgi:hypothetical protein
VALPGLEIRPGGNLRRDGKRRRGTGEKAQHETGQARRQLV